MKIRTRLYLITFATLAAAIAVAVTVIAANGYVARERAQIENVQAILEALFRLRGQTFEYLLRPEARIAVQWHVEQEEIGRRLQAVAAATPVESSIVNSLRQDHERSNAIFGQLAVLGAGAERTGGREILSGQLQLKIQSVASGVLRLEEAMRKRAAAVQQRAALLVSALMAALVAAIAIGSLLLGRSILGPLDALRRTVEAVGAGNLGYHPGLVTPDEIGELSVAFDRMTENLKRMKADVMQATSYTRSLIEASLDPLVTISAEGKITDVNKATEQATGRNRAELIGTDFTGYFTEPDKAREGYQQVFRKGFVTDYPLALRHRDGHVTDVLYNASVYRDEAGEVRGVFAAARDVTERNKAEREVAQLNMQNRLILDSVGEGIYGLDNEGRCTFVNPAAAQLLGFSAEEIVGRQSHLLFHHTRPDGSPYPQEECPLQAAYKKGAVMRGGDLYWRKDGGSFEVEFVSTPILEAGIVTGAVVAFSDITERKRDEELIRQNNKLLETMFSSIHVMIAYLDRDFNFIKVNKAYAAADQREPDFFPGKNHFDLFPYEENRAIFQKVVDTGEPVVYYAKPFEYAEHPERGVSYWDWRLEPIKGAGGKVEGLLFSLLNVTEQTLAVQNIRAASLYARNLIEASLDPLVTISAEGKITDVNEAAVQATGVPRKLLIGSDFSEYFTEPDKARAGYQAVFAKGLVTDYPLALRHASGKVMEVLYNASVYRNEKGEVAGVFAAARDITERKRAEEELRKYHEQLEELVRERTGQLEAANQDLEGFAYSVSHDLRVPLRAIDGFSHQILKRYEGKLDEEGMHYLKMVRDNTRKMSQLIDDILAFSRMGRLGMTIVEIDMDALMRSVFEDLKPGLSGRELTVEIKPLPPCQGDQAMLRQVCVNLLANAVKFTRHKEAALVEVGGHNEEAECIYYVKDNGAGFDMAYVEKLFGVFQRLHGVEDFEGTGIGLAIVKRIVTRHGGRVWAEGKVNEGATFYFALPRA